MNKQTVLKAIQKAIHTTQKDEKAEVVIGVKGDVVPINFPISKTTFVYDDDVDAIFISDSYWDMWVSIEDVSSIKIAHKRFD